jgi:pimeloyl-ACP methyl ester carboxylesterase
MAQALAAPWDVLAMDFRGHGRSGGRFAFSARESADLEAVLAWARARYRVLAVMGFSLGAAAAISTLARCADGVSGLIAVSAPCAFTDIELKWWTPEAMRTGLLGLAPGAGCRPGNPFLPKPRAIEAVARLGALPKLFLHGTRDAIVGVGHSRRLFAAAPEPKRLEIIEGGGHAEALFRDDPEGFCRLVRAWCGQRHGILEGSEASVQPPTPPSGA